MTSERRTRTTLFLEIPETSLVSFRKLLFENGLSVQEFVSHLARQSDFRTDALMELVRSAKVNKISKPNLAEIRTSANALYNFLEARSVIRDEERFSDNEKDDE